MKKNYLEPVLRIYNVRIGDVICLSGGRAGGEGMPGAEFESDDIYDGGIF